jgi:hypothetical protein
MGAVGAPRHWSFTARFKGRFRLRPGLGWMPAGAWQYNSAVDVARIFVMRIRFAGVVPVTGVDSYLRGRGRMLGKLLGVVTVADGRGGEFDIGELTTYLNDALLLAPSLLLRPGTEWKQLDEATFEVTLTDRGHRVSGRVTIDERGAPVDFVTTDRFADLPGGLRQAEWHTPIRGWSAADGPPRPESVTALWRLPEGDLPYIEGRIDDILYDELPMAAPAADGRRRLLRAGLGATQIAAVLPAAPLLRRWYTHWGATIDEARGRLPGDELVPEAQLSSTRAITIDAPAAQVWPWLAQIGQGRGGFYSYDELENLVGCHIHSAHQILADHQRLEVGDVIRLAGGGAVLPGGKSRTPQPAGAGGAIRETGSPGSQGGQLGEVHGHLAMVTASSRRWHPNPAGRPPALPVSPLPEHPVAPGRTGGLRHGKTYAPRHQVPGRSG